MDKRQSADTLLKAHNILFFRSSYDVRQTKVWDQIEGTNQSLRKVMTAMFSARPDIVFHFHEAPPFININPQRL